MTIFLGVLWAELDAQHVQDYLAQADDEPLLWEAKGTELDKKEIRRQVCAFANGHEVGYLILGADKPRGAATWVFDGLLFPGAEPMTWVSEVIGDLEVGVRPRPDFDVRSWPTTDGKHLAVVKVEPTSTPPCIANGTVYERLPGKTQVVKDPVKLAGLFSRGDVARQCAEARADAAALSVVRDWLDGEAGVFQQGWIPIVSEAEESDAPGDDSMFVRFAVGVASTGNPPNISGRLFRASFVESVWNMLVQRPNGQIHGFGRSLDPAFWSQEAVTWRHQIQGHQDAISIVRASWDGAVAVGQKIAAEDVYLDHFAASSVAQDWGVRRVPRTAPWGLRRRLRNCRVDRREVPAPAGRPATSSCAEAPSFPASNHTTSPAWVGRCFVRWAASGTSPRSPGRRFRRS